MNKLHTTEVVTRTLSEYANRHLSLLSVYLHNYRVYVSVVRQRVYLHAD